MTENRGRKTARKRRGLLAVTAIPFAVGLLVTVVLVVLAFADFRLNATSSLPVGVYRQVDEPIRRGSFVTFCLEDGDFIRLAKERGYLGKGSCPGGIKALGKEIFGLPGDVVSLQDGLISVNGATVPLSGAKIVDSQGRAMPAMPKLKSGVIPAGYALLLSPHHAGGFDSRYFGLVRLSSLRPVKPVYTW